MPYRVFSFFVSVLILISCSRDDICSEDIARTPLLSIVFRDITNPTEAKLVENLNIALVNQNNLLLVSASTDSVAIPLSVNENLTQFLFVKNTGTDNENTDQFTVNYTREDVYINRACSFKTLFNIQSLTTDTQNNWILNTEINTPDVVQNNDLHIIVYH